MAGKRLLIQGGHVLTLDPTLGDMEGADVLVEGGRIAAVGHGLADGQGGECERIDATGMIVLPGFVDTHRHTWQTALRGICADWTLMDYFRGIRLHISTWVQPEDVYAGNYVGALEALDAGVTTILDFSHCNNTPAHADEAVRGLRDAGIRATFAYGFYPVPLAEPHFTGHGQRIADAHRVRAEHFAADAGAVRMGVALTELGLIPIEATRAEVAAARELDVPVTAHIGTVADPRFPREIEILHSEGLLDERQVHVHCNACTDAELGLLADAGAAVSITPETEMQMGMGHPITGRARAAGLRAGFGCDIVSLGSGDLFTQMRMGLQMQRALDNDAAIANGELPAGLAFGARDALETATRGGAEAMGLGSLVGTLSPGKEADVLCIRTDGLNFAPPADPVAAVVLHAGRADVDTVLIGGRVVKRGGSLIGTDVARARRLGEESRERLMRGAQERGGLLLDLPDGWFDGVRAAVLENLSR